MSPPRNCYYSCFAVSLSRFFSVHVLVPCFQWLLKIPIYGLLKCTYSCPHRKISCFQLPITNLTSFAPLFALSISILVCSFNLGQGSPDNLLAASQSLFLFLLEFQNLSVCVFPPPPTQTSSHSTTTAL